MLKALKSLEQAEFYCLGELDGRALVHVAKGELRKGHSMSAMGSSLLALSETFAGEAMGHTAEFNLVNTSDGCLVTIRVAGEAKDYVLSLGVDGLKTPAIALRSALDVASAIAPLLP